MSGKPFRFRKAAALLALLLLCAGVPLLLARPEEHAAFPIDVDVLVIESPAAVAAGEWFDVEVTGGDDGQSVSLSLEAGYGSRTFQAISRVGVATFKIPPENGPASGVAMLVARSIGRISSSTLEIQPESAVGPVDLYLGPRTVIADAQHFSMLVAVPTDAFGNPVADDTDVDVLVTRGTLETETRASTTEGLLSYVEVFSGTVAGRTRLSVDVGDAFGPERSFLEVAGIPERFTLLEVDPIPPADGQALVRLRTGELRDRFDNPLPDGTVVFLDASGASGNRRLRSVSIEAVAEFVFEVPDRPGSVDLVATASGTQSETLSLTFTAAVEEIPIVVEPHPDGSLIRIGRIVGSRGSYVPDGTSARIVTAGGETEVPLELGAASAVVPEISGPLDVSVLGTTVSGSLDIER